MTYPTATDLKLLDLAFQGQPFVQVPAGAATTAGLDLAAQAQPFSATDLTTPAASTNQAAFFLLF